MDDNALSVLVWIVLEAERPQRLGSVGSVPRTGRAVSRPVGKAAGDLLDGTERRESPE